MRETFWPTVGMVEPALGGRGPFGRYSDFTFSRRVYAGERVQGGEGGRGGVCEETDGFPGIVEAQKPGGRADQRWQRWIGGETHGGCLRWIDGVTYRTEYSSLLVA